MDLLKNEWAQRYDRLVIFSPTIAHQTVWEGIDLSDVETFSSVTNAHLQGICAEREANYATTSLLVVFDDMGEDLRHVDQSLLNKAVSNSRHLKLSMVFLNQKLTQSPTVVRTNADTFLIFSSSSFCELDALWREVSCVDRKQFSALMRQATSDDYGCLVCSTSKEGRLCFYNRAGDFLY